jgi:L-histidine Nalpha-methyltransferase
MPTRLFASPHTLEATARHSEFTRTEFARDVREGLTAEPQKTLPAKYLYDAIGSGLFEVITLLPEYGLSRADERILCRSSSEIARRVSRHRQLPGNRLRDDTRADHQAQMETQQVENRIDKHLVVELGCGSGRKARTILTALRNAGSSVRYMPIDVAQDALIRSVQDLSSLCEVHPIQAEFLEGLQSAVGRRLPGENLLVLFLGSTIGNFEREPAAQLLADIRELLIPGDNMLLGADLMKPADILIPAYDDAAGVTAAFDLNLLARINRELGAQFDLRLFRHQAVLNEELSRVEMHLISQKTQCIEVPGAAFTASFHRGETIHTESSHKYTEQSLLDTARDTGWAAVQSWRDSGWALTENLWRVP